MSSHWLGFINTVIIVIYLLIKVVIILTCNVIVTAEERKERNALNAPYFLVALKDTEIMENTYLRFMVKVKGDPNPEVKL